MTYQRPQILAKRLDDRINELSCIYDFQEKKQTVLTRKILTLLVSALYSHILFYKNSNFSTAILIETGIFPAPTVKAELDYHKNAQLSFHDHHLKKFMRYLSEAYKLVPSLESQVISTLQINAILKILSINAYESETFFNLKFDKLRFFLRAGSQLSPFLVDRTYLINLDQSYSLMTLSDGVMTLVIPGQEAIIGSEAIYDYFDLLFSENNHRLKISVQILHTNHSSYVLTTSQDQINRAFYFWGQNAEFLQNIFPENNIDAPYLSIGEEALMGENDLYFKKIRLLKKVTPPLTGSWINNNRLLKKTNPVIILNQELAYSLSQNSSLLHRAVHHKMIALVKLLVTDGVSPNVLDEKAETPLAKAISMNFKTIAGYLLKHGACPQLGDKKSALHYAVVNKDKYSIAMTKLMLSVLKNSNQKESFLESLFYTALKANNKTVCELLMKKFSVDPLLPKIQLSIEENSVLELVVEHQFNLILEALMTKGVDLNCINEQGESLLVQALRKKNKKTVSLLLKNGASPTFGGPRSALNYSIARKDLFDTTKNMLQHILSTSDAGKNLCLESALYTAIKETNMQVVDFLLAHDVNPFLPSLPRYQWEDSCVLAILSQDLILLQKISHYNGVRLPFTFSVDGYTPLNFAIRLKNASMVKFFLERDSAINEVNDSNQFSPLYQAVESGDEKIFSLLMTAGANPYQRNYYGTSSPFHLLIQFNQISLLKILLKHSENVDYQHEDRQLALSLLTHNSLAHQVARYGSIEMIGLLSFYGFSFLQKNKLNKTPLDLGKKRGDSLVIKALQDAVLKEEDLNETELLKEDIAAEYELIQKLTSLSFLGFSKSNPSKPVSPAASTKTQRNNL